MRSRSSINNSSSNISRKFVRPAPRRPPRRLSSAGILAGEGNMKRLFQVLLPLTAVLSAHPLGNLTVSHYTRIEVSPKGVAVNYILDLAETPAYQLLRDWKLTGASPQAALESKAREQAQAWLAGLDFSTDGKRLEPQLVGTKVQLSDGVDGLKMVRIAYTLLLDPPQDRLDFEDRNFAARPGWKEIVIGARDGAQIVTASQPPTDRSNELTRYPGVASTLAGAPQDLRASVEWRAGQAAAAPKIVPIDQPPAVPNPS